MLAGHLAGVAVIGYADKPGKTQALADVQAAAVTTELAEITTALLHSRMTQIKTAAPGAQPDLVNGGLTARHRQVRSDAAASSGPRGITPCSRSRRPCPLLARREEDPRVVTVTQRQVTKIPAGYRVSRWQRYNATDFPS